MTALKTTRRRLMMGLAAATATASASTTRAEAQECPALLDLSDQLETALARHTDAAQNVTSIAAQWGPQWPAAPEATRWYISGSVLERDILGAGIQRPNQHNPSLPASAHKIGTPDGFRASIKAHTARIAAINETKSKRGLKSEQAWLGNMQTALPLSEAYWAEVERIKAESGIDAAQSAVSEARRALKTLVGAIVMHREKTVTGLLIKAQAMQAWASVPMLDQAANLDGPKWADEIAATIVRQAGGAA